MCPSYRQQVRGLTDNNNINYRTDGDKDRCEATGEKPSVTRTQFDRELERDRCELDRDRVDLERERDSRDRRSDEQMILDLKDYRERERDRELSTTPVDHFSSKRKRKNSSSNCDNSLTSTHSANVQERNYSQDTQVSAAFFLLLHFNKEIFSFLQYLHTPLSSLCRPWLHDTTYILIFLSQ